jgi:hypothetical protein
MIRIYLTVICIFVSLLLTACATIGVDVVNPQVEDHISLPQGQAAVRGSYDATSGTVGDLLFLLTIVGIDGKPTSAVSDAATWFSSIGKKNAATWQQVSPGLHVFDMQIMMMIGADPGESRILSLPLEVKPDERYTFAIKNVYGENHFLSWSGVVLEIRVLNHAGETVAVRHATLCRGAPASIWACQQALEHQQKILTERQ